MGLVIIFGYIVAIPFAIFKYANIISDFMLVRFFDDGDDDNENEGDDESFNKELNDMIRNN